MIYFMLSFNDNLIGYTDTWLKLSPLQYHRAPFATVPQSAEGRVPRGEAQYHLKPGLRQRGHWDPAAFPG